MLGRDEGSVQTRSLQTEKLFASLRYYTQERRSPGMDELAHPGAVAVPSIAAESGSKARMFEHRDVRVRAGPLAARSAGDSDSLDANQNATSGA